MKKRNLALIGVLAIVLTGLIIWMSQRGEQPEQAVEDIQVLEEKSSETETTEEETPTEFQDNLDGAFEDLDAVEF